MHEQSGQQSHTASALRKIADLFPPESFELWARFPFLQLCVRTLVLLVMFLAVDRFMLRVIHLPTESYEQPFLFLEVLKRLGAIGIVAIGAVAFLLSRYGTLLSKWDAFDHARELRWFIVFLAALMAWPFATPDYNYYFDQGYYVDRILITVLFALIYFRPIFVFPFLILVFAMMWQLDHPGIGGFFIFPHKLQVLHVLNLFGAVFLLHAVTGNRRTDGFFFFTCCLVAAGYWQPALWKFKIDWLTYGHLHFMPLAAHAHGWLAFLPASTVVNFANFVTVLDRPLQILTIAIEAGCLLFLINRHVSIALLISLIVFHLGVFAFYGYLFWTWILLNTALVVVLTCDLGARQIPIYGRGPLLISILLIGYGSYWCNPSTLAWFDTRLSYTYRYDAIGESGERYELPPHFFTPYADLFTMADFGYLVDSHQMLVAPYGITGNRNVADRLLSVNTPSDVFTLEDEIGVTRYDAERAAAFHSFVTRYLANRNTGGSATGAIDPLRAPAQFWSFGRGNVSTSEEPIRTVTVKEITTLFDDERLFEIRNLPVVELPIP